MTFPVTLDIGGAANDYHAAVSDAYNAFAENVAYEVLAKANEAVEAGLTGDELQDALDDIIEVAAKGMAQEAPGDSQQEHRERLIGQLDANGGSLAEIVDQPEGGYWIVAEVDGKKTLAFDPEKGCDDDSDYDGDDGCCDED